MISIIIPWRNRPQIYGTLDLLHSIITPVKGEIIIVAHGAKLDNNKELLIKYPSLSIVELNTTGPFNKGEAQNIGAQIALNEILFFSDCDIIYHSDQIIDLANLISSRDNIFISFLEVWEKEPGTSWDLNRLAYFSYTMKIKADNGNEVIIHCEEESLSKPIKTGPGLLMVRKEHFLEIDGYYSEFDGWGWEDHDMLVRLSLKLGIEHVRTGSCIHMSHSHELRTENFENQNSGNSRDKNFRKAYDRYNQGQYLGSLSSNWSTFKNRLIIHSNKKE